MKITVDKALIEQAVKFCEAWPAYGGRELAGALRAALAEPAQTTCNCRWEGGTQVQQCTLHQAHIEAIHEWVERAKAAEKKLAQPVVKDCLTTEPAVEPVKFLANGTRFKMSFFHNEDSEGQVAEGMYVTCFEGFEDELNGRWVALVAAENDCNMKLHTSPPPPAKPAVEPEPIGEVVACNDHGHPWKRVSGYEWSLAELPIGTKVYASPPAEVPLLSDEEMMEMVTANAGYGGTNFDRVARAIEQAVRQKAGL